MAWWDDYFRDVDTFDIYNVAPWLDENVVLRFANWPETRGKDATVESLKDFWAHLKGLRHSVTGVLEHGTRVCVEADITFIRSDGREIAARAATVFDRPGDKITELYVYADVTPVFA